jgi:hypothetical protein
MCIPRAFHIALNEQGCKKASRVWLTFECESLSVRTDGDAEYLRNSKMGVSFKGVAPGY